MAALPSSSVRVNVSLGLPRGSTSKQADAHARAFVDAGRLQVLQGWFKDTLPAFLAQHPEHVSLLHIDCDLYSSTAEVLHQLRGRIRAGCVIVFDELLNYLSFERHELLAFFEFASQTQLQFSWIGMEQSESMPVALVIDYVPP